MQTEAATTVGGSTRKLVVRPPPVQQQKQQSQVGTVSQLIAGGVAGAVSKTCTAPLARLTILFQVQGMHSDASTLRKTTIWREASRIVNEEGFRAFWKGNLVTIAHRLPYSSISFYAFERYKNVGTNLLQLIMGAENHGTNISTDLFIRLAGGGLAGITAASVTYPLEGFDNAQIIHVVFTRRHPEDRYIKTKYLYVKEHIIQEKIINQAQNAKCAPHLPFVRRTYLQVKDSQNHINSTSTPHNLLCAPHFPSDMKNL
ncbi:mitochondrial substrate carrier family protein B-like protein [Tanacetum coccineum]|uniref:Mitochondrial substrate carrier family protein B-like protein n=1 Tax=Tanacetum coccineum TaxID=301880 RepID=A0ABQ5DJW6_9ASTR